MEFLLGKLKMDRETDKKRPMIFGHDKAFKQLEENGMVWSCRKHRKKRGPVWIRRSRTGPKEFDAEIKEWETAKNLGVGNTIDEKGPWSGFDSAEEWKEAVKENSDGEIPDKATFHLVVRKNAKIDKYGKGFEKSYE
jgi:hypothetical protein